MRWCGVTPAFWCGEASRRGHAGQLHSTTGHKLVGSNWLVNQELKLVLCDCDVTLPLTTWADLQSDNFRMSKKGLFWQAVIMDQPKHPFDYGCMLSTQAVSAQFAYPGSHPVNGSSDEQRKHRQCTSELRPGRNFVVSGEFKHKDRGSPGRNSRGL